MYTKEQIKSWESLSKHFLKSKVSPGEIDELRDVLRFHEYRYYIANDPLISDTEYDSLYKMLEKA